MLRRRDRGDALPAEPARRAGAAARGDVRGRRVARRRAARGASVASRTSPSCRDDVFAAVLDLLSGRYPSDDFAELRPRLVWDRTSGVVRAREGAGPPRHHERRHDPRPRPLRRVPARRHARRRARRGDGVREPARRGVRAGRAARGGSRTSRATASWSSPAPGEPGKMPFWKGDKPGRPLELGRAIGRVHARARDGAPRRRARAAARRRRPRRAGRGELGQVP